MFNIVTDFSELNKINLFKEELDGVPLINKIDTDKKTNEKEPNTKLKAFNFNSMVNSQGPVGTFIGNNIEKFIKTENKCNWIQNNFFYGEVNRIKKENECFNSNPECSINEVICITKDGFLFGVLKKTNKKELPNVVLELIKSIDKNNEIDSLTHKYLIFKGSINTKKGVQKIYITAEGKVLVHDSKLVHHSKIDGNDKTSSSKLKIEQAIKKEVIPEVILNKIESELYTEENKEFEIKYTLQIKKFYELSSGEFFSDTGQKITFE